MRYGNQYRDMNLSAWTLRETSTARIELTCLPRELVERSLFSAFVSWLSHEIYAKSVKNGKSPFGTLTYSHIRGGKILSRSWALGDELEVISIGKTINMWLSGNGIVTVCSCFIVSTYPREKPIIPFRRVSYTPGSTR
jgi:hypothetical protein